MRTRASLLVVILTLTLAAILLSNRHSMARAADDGRLRTFTPAEEVSADQAVAFPTDI
jgi:hypothetical protein